MGIAWNGFSFEHSEVEPTSTIEDWYILARRGGLEGIGNGTGVVQCLNMFEDELRLDPSMRSVSGVDYASRHSY